MPMIGTVKEQIGALFNLACAWKLKSVFVMIAIQIRVKFLQLPLFSEARVQTGRFYSTNSSSHTHLTVYEIPVFKTLVEMMSFEHGS